MPPQRAHTQTHIHTQRSCTRRTAAFPTTRAPKKSKNFLRFSDTGRDAKERVFTSLSISINLSLAIHLYLSIFVCVCVCLCVSMLLRQFIARQKPSSSSWGTPAATKRALGANLYRRGRRERRRVPALASQSTGCPSQSCTHLSVSIFGLLVPPGAHSAAFRGAGSF